MDVRKAWEVLRDEMARSVPKFKRCRFHDLRHIHASDAEAAKPVSLSPLHRRCTAVAKRTLRQLA